LDPLELIALCAWCFAVALAGRVVGLVLGNIRLPAVLLVASHPAAGAGANVGISGVAATAAAIGLALVYFGIDLLRRHDQPPRRRNGRQDDELDIRAAVITGAGVGLLGGFVGLILGALRIPALLRYVGETPARAIGTNLSVGVCVGIAGVIGHTPDGVDWELLAIGSAASVPGALLGARLTGRLSERQLLRAIGAMLVVAGTTTALSALL
jgi:uncharacterized protein